MKKLLDNGKEFNSGRFEKESYEVDWLGGSFLMLSKETFLAIDGFDEDYFISLYQHWVFGFSKTNKMNVTESW